MEQTAFIGTYHFCRFQKLFQEKPKEPLRYPVGKLKIEMGNKVLENDPESKLPWEFQASKDKAEDKVDKMKERMKPVKELKIISGVPRVTSVEAEVHLPGSGESEVHIVSSVNVLTLI